MLRLALLLIASSMIFGLATFGPFAFLLVMGALAGWAFWRSRQPARA